MLSSLKAKIPSWCGVSIVMAGMPSIAAQKPGDSGQQEVIQLSDGTKLTFLGVTHGRHHRAPHYENMQTGNWIYTPGDATVAWIEAEHDPKQWPSYELLVSDKENTGCVPTEKRSSSHVKDGVDIQGFVLNAFPRWDKKMILRARLYHEPIAPGQFVVSNAEPGLLASWTPESLPATKSDGDFQVTLSNLMAGVPIPYRRGTQPPGKDAANQCVRIAFGFQQNGQTATNWNPKLVKTSDAAGNVVRSVISDYPEGGVYDYPRRGQTPDFHWDGHFYRPGLWPDASPWKLLMEFTRTSGFNDDETLTLTNLPVRVGTQKIVDEEWTMEPSANFNFMLGKVNGVQLKVLAPLQFPDRLQNGKKIIRILIFADSNPALPGMRLTLLDATDDQGKAVWSPFPAAWANHFSLDLPYERDTKTLNLKLALHKSRFV